MPKLGYPESDLIWDFGLRREFFERNVAKVHAWFLEAQQIIAQKQGKNYGIVADTGGGKTVMALLVSIMTGHRTLFMVPTKELAKEHQYLYWAMGGQAETSVITGDTPFHYRDWVGDDQIIFTTGSLVQKELEYEELPLNHFDMVVMDEVHHAATPNYSYSIIAKAISEFQNRKHIFQLVLTASPGNKTGKIHGVWKNCRLDQLAKIEFPNPGEIVSVLLAEESKQIYNQTYATALELLVGQLHNSLQRLNETAVQLPLGKALTIDPTKFFRLSQLNGLRKQAHSLGEIITVLPQQKKLVKQLVSRLEHYAFWAHYYELFTTQSFHAMREYYHNNFLKKDKWYVKEIARMGMAQMILALTNGLIHPKIDLLGEVMESLVRLDKQVIIFEDNKATALACYEHLSRLGIKADAIWSGKKMTPTIKRAVIQKMKDRQISCLATTDLLKEGIDLSVDVVVHMSPPGYPIKMIQRNGRAGRGGKPREIIYIGCAHETFMIPAVQRQVRRLGQIDYNSGKMPH